MLAGIVKSDTMLSNEERKQVCRQCSNKGSDFSLGLICELTGKAPDFADKCEFLNVNPKSIVNTESSIDEVVKEGVPGELKIASKGKRFANHMLDLVFLYVFAIISGIILVLFLVYLDPSYIYSMEEDNWFTDYLFGFIIVFIYYFISEATTGRTLGKLITKTKVVDLNGNKPNAIQIMKRTFSRMIPFEAFSFLGSDDLGLHDTLSKTRVVSNK